MDRLPSEVILDHVAPYMDLEAVENCRQTCRSLLYVMETHRARYLAQTPRGEPHILRCRRLSTKMSFSPFYSLTCWPDVEGANVYQVQRYQLMFTAEDKTDSPAENDHCHNVLNDYDDDDDDDYSVECESSFDDDESCEYESDDDSYSMDNISPGRSTYRSWKTKKRIHVTLKFCNLVWGEREDDFPRMNANPPNHAANDDELPSLSYASNPFAHLSDDSMRMNRPVGTTEVCVEMKYVYRKSRRTTSSSLVATTSRTYSRKFFEYDWHRDRRSGFGKPAFRQHDHTHVPFAMMLLSVCIGRLPELFFQQAATTTRNRVSSSRPSSCFFPTLEYIAECALTHKLSQYLLPYLSSAASLLEHREEEEEEEEEDHEIADRECVVEWQYRPATSAEEWCKWIKNRFYYREWVEYELDELPWYATRGTKA